MTRPELMLDEKTPARQEHLAARFQAGLVSTIVPVFNRPAMLRRAVGSVVAQTYRPIEIIIVNDGSTDETPATCDALARDYPSIVRVVHQANGGPGAARERGRQLASGEFIQHLDSDDALLPGKFAAQVGALREHRACDVAYGWTRLVEHGAAAERPYKRTGERIATMFPSMLQSRWWETATPLYRAEIIAAAGPWTEFRAEEDWEYDCRIASTGARLAYVDEWVSECHRHDAGHLSGGQQPWAFHDRARAHALILGHAFAAGIALDAPEMQHFARELFLLARQCGALGLADDSRRLLELSLVAATDRRVRAQLHVYGSLARLAGWVTAGRMASGFDRLR